MRKNFLLILICIFCTIYMSSCNILSTDVDDLIKPPQPTGEKAEIQKVIEDSVKESFTLKYPFRGEYRSAIIMKDIDNNGIDEAIALFKINNDKDNYTHIMFIGYIDNSWTCIGNYTNSAQDIDTVLFSDINNDNKEEIIIGWKTYATGMNGLSAYVLENGNIREMNMDEKYSEIMLADIDNDLTDEIILLSLSTTDNPSAVSMLKYSSEYSKPMLKSTVSINHDITRFINISFGNINKDTKGIVIDGYKNSSIVTDMLYWDKDTSSLVNTLMSPTDIRDNPTIRVEEILACDINGDKIIEVPFVLTMLGMAENESSKICKETYWRQYDSEIKNFVTVRDMVINYTYRFFVDMPKNWSGNVTARSYFDDTIMSFYEWKISDNTSSGYIGKEILRFKVMPSKDYSKDIDGKEYNIIYEDSENIYLYKINKDSDYAITENDVSKCFGMLANYQN